MIGEKIREYREGRGYSVEELGKLCEFGKDAKRIIADFEEDKGFPDIEKLKKVAEVLAVPLEVLCPVACKECPYKKQ